MGLRAQLKKFVWIKQVVFLLRFLRYWPSSLLSRLKLRLASPQDWNMAVELKQKVRGMFPLNLNLTNPQQWYFGKNVLGYPAMSDIMLNGEPVGWSSGKIVSGQHILRIIQLKTDLEKNLLALFDRYRLEAVVDCGTASGGTAVLYHQFLSKYCQVKISLKEGLKFTKELMG